MVGTVTRIQSLTQQVQFDLYLFLSPQNRFPENNIGANPIDIIDNAAQIKKAKKECDFVIVIAHGGHEYYNLPSPRMQKLYRFFAENGADIVIGHHTHCVSGHAIHFLLLKRKKSSAQIFSFALNSIQ